MRFHVTSSRAIMRSTINKIRRSLAMRGVMGTAAMCAVNLVNTFDGQARRIETERQESDAAFDNHWNVDTGGLYRPKEDEVCGENWAQGVRYQAVNAQALRETLGGLEISHREFTFLDFGSGKGRALLVASEFGFRRIVGIEYCGDLNRIAAENVKRHAKATPGCGEIELIACDAAAVALPGGPLVIYLFNPFSRAVMSKVVNNVTDSFREKPRRMIVVYFTPYDADLWAATGFLKRRNESPAIFDTGIVS
jgi:SAM-dependent methyltransferase